MNGFLDLIVDTWQILIDGNPMYRFTKRLGLLKPKLKSLHHQYTSHTTSYVVEAKTKWTVTQTTFNGSF